MIYEGTIQFTITQDGNERTKKETFIIDNCDTFAHAEIMLIECNAYRELSNFDVIAIKRSKLREIVNSPTDDFDKIFIADVMDIYTDDNDEEKELIYRVVGFAKDLKAAHEFMNEYLKQGFNMQLVGLKMTKIIGVLNS